MSAGMSNVSTPGSAYRRVEEALERFGSVRSIGGDWQCPAHDDHNPSLSVSDRDGRALVCCHKGCSAKEVTTALNLQIGDLFDEPRLNGSTARRTAAIDQKRKIVLVRYEYTDRNGEVLSTKTRYEPKDFSWDNGNPRVLYRLPEIVEADVVYISEGEKAADRLSEALPAGHASTCAPTTKWEGEYDDLLRGKRVVIIADRDDAGLKQASAAHKSLRSAGIDARLFHPATTEDKSDAYDHFEAGFGVDDFVQLREQERTTPQRLSFRPAWAVDDNEGLDSPYWIKRIIPGGGVGYFFGGWGVGKTFVALDAGSAIADGRPFLGHRTNQGLAFFSFGEGQVGLRRRVRALRVEGALRSDNLMMRDRAVDMRDPENVDAMIEDIQRTADESDLPVACIFLDTLRRHMGSGEENPGPDTAAVFDAACLVRDAFPGSSVVLIAHEGYTAGRIRGHSNQPSDADFLVRFSREKDSPVGRWSVDKSKDGEGVSGTYQLRVRHLGIDDSDGEPLTSMVVDSISVDGEAMAKPLTKHESIVRNGLKTFLSITDGTNLEGADCVDKKLLHEWVERNAGVTREQRRGVVFKGLKGLKDRGLVRVEGQKIFMLGELP